MSFKNQDIAIAVSNEVVLSMQLNSIIDPYKRGGRLKVRVIQNGVNTKAFQRIEDSSALKSNLGIPENAPVIGKVAVFRSQKRLWLWVELALEILEKYPDTHFLLVGDGEWRERLEEQIQKSGKGKNFHLVGVQKNVIPYLSLMDIYLSTSEFEGLPIAMLEAMSCQVPVVATRAGGIGEVIQEGVQGYLTGIDDWKELNGFCQVILKNTEVQKNMGKEARKRVVEDFSMKKMVSELEEVYFSVLSDKIIS